MIEIEALVARLMEQAKAMDGLPREDRRPFDLSMGEMGQIAMALSLLLNIRHAANMDFK